jgi:hypothetical protein
MTPDQELQLRKDYMQTFNTPTGANVLKDLAVRCFKYVPTDDEANPYITERNEGKRQVLLHIENMMSEEGINRLSEAQPEGSK